MLRFGAGSLPHLALDPSHVGTNNAIGRQGIGVGSRPEIFMDKESGQLEADWRDNSQRAEDLGERELDRGVKVVPESSLPLREDEAGAPTQEGGGGEEGTVVSRGFLAWRTGPAVVIVLGRITSLRVIDVEAEGYGGRARRGSFPNPDSDAMRPVMQPGACRSQSDE